MSKHAVVKAIEERRSWRIFMEDPVPAAAIESIAAVTAAAPSVRGGKAARVELVTDPGRVEGLRKAVLGNIMGKSNAWLYSAPPPAWAVLAGDASRGVMHGDRHLYNVDVAIAGQLMALAAAANNLGSCWMSAIHMAGVIRYMELGEDGRVPAVIALGEAGIRRKGALLASGWNRFTAAKISGRRKSMETLCHLDRFGSGASLPLTPLDDIEDDGRDLLQVVEALAPSATFAGEAPAEHDLARLISALRLAPSADNAQTWRFVVVRGKENTGPLLEAAGHPTDTPPGVVIALAAAPFIIKKVNKEQPFFLIDHPIALTHAMLLAELLGLHWNALFRFDHEAVRRHIGAPANHPVTALFALDRGGERSVAPHPDHVQLFR